MDVPDNDGRETPATPRPAATVILVRDGAPGLEVFLLRRVTGMAFAPNMSVFPGGGVDDGDREPGATTWSGPGPSWWARRFDCDEPLAGALVRAAVRETVEECGVLLAGPDPVTVPDGEPDAESVAVVRAELLARRGPLEEVLARRGWRVRADLLRPWANWITPEAEPRRYDARFFVAVLPGAQRADGDTSEADHAGWWRPADALAAGRGGEIRLMTPTRITLEELAQLPDTAAVLAAAAGRPLRPVRPVARRDGDRLLVSVPGRPGEEPMPLPPSRAGRSEGEPGRAGPGHAAPATRPDERGERHR